MDENSAKSFRMKYSRLHFNVMMQYDFD